VGEAKVAPSSGVVFQHFQSPAAVPRLHTWEDTPRDCMWTDSNVRASKHRQGWQHPGEKRTWVNAPKQAIMHLELWVIPLLFTRHIIFPPPWPQWDGSWSWKKSTSSALWFFPQPDGSLIFGSSCSYNFRAQDCIREPKFPPWMPSSAQCWEERSLAGAGSYWGGRSPPLLFQEPQPPSWLQAAGLLQISFPMITLKITCDLGWLSLFRLFLSLLLFLSL